MYAYVVSLCEFQGVGDPDRDGDSVVRCREFTDADMGETCVSGVEEAECHGLGEVCVRRCGREELFEGRGGEEDSIRGIVGQESDFQLSSPVQGVRRGGGWWYFASYWPAYGVHEVVVALFVV